MLGSLIHGEVDGERLTHDELVQNCIFLLNAGHETTTNLIGNTIDALLRFPDELQRLKKTPALLRVASRKAAFRSSNQLGNRRLAADLEIGGETLSAGTYIHIGIGAATATRRVRRPDRFERPRAQPHFASARASYVRAPCWSEEGTLASAAGLALDGLAATATPSADGRAPPPTPSRASTAIHRRE